MIIFVYYILQALEIILFANGIVRLEFHKSRIRILAGIITLVAGAAVYAFCPDENVSMIVGMILLQIVGTLLLFKVRLIEGIFKYNFSSAYASVFHLPVNLIFTILDENAVLYLSDDVRKIVLTIVTIVMIQIISHFIGKNKSMVTWIKDIPIGYFILAWLCGTSTNGITAGIKHISGEINKSVRLLLNIFNFMVSMFLYAVGLGFAVANLWRKQYKRENELKDEYIKKTKEYHQSLSENINEIRRIKHDIDSHLSILSRYAEADDFDNLKRYLKEIIAKQQSQYNDTVIIDVGNSMVSAVITDKMRMVNGEEGISIVCDGTLPEKLLISDYDLCTIFSNLIANSIDACCKLNESERKIHIEFGMKKNSLSIICDNPVEWEVDIEKLNKGHTSKKDRQRHGYGITNIRRAVENYDSDMKMYVKDKMFITKIVFYKAIEQR